MTLCIFVNHHHNHFFTNYYSMKINCLYIYMSRFSRCAIAWWLDQIDKCRFRIVIFTTNSISVLISRQAYISSFLSFVLFLLFLFQSLHIHKFYIVSFYFFASSTYFPFFWLKNRTAYFILSSLTRTFIIILGLCFFSCLQFPDAFNKLK
jgi:hypothetical protein